MQFITYRGQKFEISDNALVLGNQGIEKISKIIGLKELLNLKSLYLFNNNISEIRDLDNLINLEKLNLYENERNLN